MAQEAQNMDIIGLQLCNEATSNAPGMYSWYNSTIAAIANINQTIPIYISDGWNLSRCLDYTTGRRVQSTPVQNPIVVDTHKYYCFSDADRSQSPQQIIARIPGELSELDGKAGSLFNRGEAQLVVGEYSCVLDEQSWAKADPSQRANQVKEFGQAESHQWQARTGGCYFWTYKMVRSSYFFGSPLQTFRN
jgi:hypothetical protein